MWTCPWLAPWLTYPALLIPPWLPPHPTVVMNKKGDALQNVSAQLARCKGASGSEELRCVEPIYTPCMLSGASAHSGLWFWGNKLCATAPGTIGGGKDGALGFRRQGAP